ncbi:bZIP transcription factor [Aspergillus alliaceus]|uniref:bZIP transcription factor n=1 Tax=Petromyces alliaceus TaxID=209559 RepID=UPI0012A6E237|nr:uncharacterized protein BDW43DRAFT_313227 [Aspergillus alliaceus]KAB8231145.1 hypothetical protein BDW43DRAFT_313227 [Aspergillus alliaceus]
MVNPWQTSPDSRLQDMLSARQYILAECDGSAKSELVPTETIVSDGEQEQTISSTAQRAESSHTEKAKQDKPSKNMSKLRSRRNVCRSSGRPRLDAGSGEAILSEDRRDQIRRAQRTYRLKKEASYESAKERVAELENTLNEVASAIEDYKAAFPSELRTSHPALLRHLDCMRNLLILNPEALAEFSARKGSPPSADSEEIPSPLQQDVVTSDHSSKINCDCLEDYIKTKCPDALVERVKKRPRHVSFSDEVESKSNRCSVRIQDIAQSQRRDTHYTYSFREEDFCRRLHRYCLEYAFRLFSDPRSQPLEVYRVFRLVPCIKNRAQMYPIFRRLVSGGAKDSLEISSLPFYTVGGAGTHYPKKNDLGNPIYPSNMRVPKRVLGLFQTSGATTDAGQALNHQKYLELCGYGGEWFDCRDVEGYLREKGVNLYGSSLCPIVRSDRIRQPAEPHGQDKEMNSSRSKPGSNSPITAHEGTENLELTMRPKSNMLDIEQFLSRLLRGVVILGRAPGFRQTDVAAAFKSALRTQTQ